VYSGLLGVWTVIHVLEFNVLLAVYRQDHNAHWTLGYCTLRQLQLCLLSYREHVV
jgi:hypothetical protein